MTVFANLNLGASAWLAIPAMWGKPFWESAEEWATGASAETWLESKLPHEPVDVDRLAAVLVTCCDKWGPGAVHPEQAANPGLEVQTALHLPDPRLIPLPARVMVVDAAMVADQKLTLREIVDADDLLAISAPHVEQIENPNLGAGLVAYRLRPMEIAPNQAKDYDNPVYAVIRYAFPVPGHEDIVLITVSWPDLARVTAARADLDQFAQGVGFVYHPDDSGA